MDVDEGGRLGLGVGIWPLTAFDWQTKRRFDSRTFGCWRAFARLWFRLQLVLDLRGVVALMVVVGLWSLSPGHRDTVFSDGAAIFDRQCGYRSGHPDSL